MDKDRWIVLLIRLSSSSIFYNFLKTIISIPRLVEQFSVQGPLVLDSPSSHDSQFSRFSVHGLFVSACSRYVCK